MGVEGTQLIYNKNHHYMALTTVTLGKHFSYPDNGVLGVYTTATTTANQTLGTLRLGLL